MHLRLRGRSGDLRESPPPAVHASRVALDSWREWTRTMLIAVAAGAFLALVGPFGTYAAPLGVRLWYWTPLVILGALFGRLAGALVNRIPRASANEWFYSVAVTVALTAPTALIVWLYTSAFFGARLSVNDLPFYFAAVLVISAPMTAIMMLAGRPGRVTHAAADAPSPVRFLERLPEKLRGAELYAISAEDHYLRLHTSKGTDLILMRLGDAISELEGVEGAQVHRSWWVSKQAVEAAARESGRWVLRLKSGATAPVSRANVRALRELGWF